ncbi:hypothetical protein [Streptomyces sp. 43Y-GA-1]|uniref:hypothetical protein n=1 Tax=Streptomyces sp. 43Y-GA-1 TaxID=2939435 RepID=UPI0020C0DECF|nr:hypothetical protein [Streptomyces sp. 43Y-GA-1]MCL6289507.1 hypothetical protein [Streptomyces sp. 43Y-GA-1]
MSAGSGPGAEAPKPVHGRPRRRLPVLAAALLLCAAPIASAAAGAAEGHPPAHGAAFLYISDYTHNTVLRLPPGGGDPVTVPADGLARPTGMALDASGDLYIADSGDNRSYGCRGTEVRRSPWTPSASPAPSGWP